MTFKLFIIIGGSSPAVLRGSPAFFKNSKKNKKIFEKGSLSLPMTGVNLPAPIGAPQLVVTHKGASIVDAHIPDKVLLHVRLPKEGACGATGASATYGPWTLKLLENRTVYCSFADAHSRGIWRAELLPRGQHEGKTVIALNTGFHSTEQLVESRLFFFFGCLVMFVMVALFSAMMNRNMEERFQLQETLDVVRQLVGDLHDRNPEISKGPVGPPGRCLDCKQDVPPTPPPPPKEEVPRFRNINPNDFVAVTEGYGMKIHGAEGILIENVAAPPPASIYTKDTMKPGTQLETGKSLIFGEYRLSVNRCQIDIEGTAADWDRELDGYEIIGNKPMDASCVLAMQHDGNLVMYHPEKGAVWASRDKLGKLCPLGVTVTKQRELVCQVKQEEEKEKVYTTDAMVPGNELAAGSDLRIKLGDYQLGLQDCSIIMFGPPPKGDRVIANVPGTGCRLGLFPDGNLVLYAYEKGVLWSSIKDRKMEPCKKGMTVNKDGFLICVK